MYTRPSRCVYSRDTKHLFIRHKPHDNPDLNPGNYAACDYEERPYNNMGRSSFMVQNVSKRLPNSDGITFNGARMQVG